MAAASRRHVLAVLEASTACLAGLISTRGWTWLGVMLLFASATSGWLEAPLEGAIPGYRVALSAATLGTPGAGSAPPLFSFGVVCAVGALVAAWAQIWTAPWWLRAHLGAAVLAASVSFPLIVATRNTPLLEAVTTQGAEREAIRRFAELVGGYSSSLPALDLAGTATLLHRAHTTLQVLGWGWWFGLVGAALLIVTALGRAARAPGLLAVGGWIVAIVLLSSVIAGPAVVAEYHRLQGDALYAAGQYTEALARYDDVLRWAPPLRENAALQYRRGAAEFWLGGAHTAGGRVFLAENLRRRGELDRALDLVGPADLDRPGVRWLRRGLAEAYAELGVEEARLGTFGTPAARWQRAREIDASLPRIHYYLAHAYYRLHGREQERAIVEAGHLATLVRDRGILSDVFALLGDCHFKAERDVDAREMYQKALRMVPLFSRVNLQAQKGLIGL
jgi:hypothetical protein